MNEKTSKTITKIIGNTTFEVRIHFSKNSKENLNDKLFRLINNDIARITEAS